MSYKLETERLRKEVIDFIKKSDQQFSKTSFDRYSLVELIELKTRIELGTNHEEKVEIKKYRKK